MAEHEPVAVANFRRRLEAQIASIAIAGAIVLAGCITELQGLLFLQIDVLPPDTTSQLTVSIAGRVIRSPVKQGLETTLHVTGGAEPVNHITEDFGLFDVSVPLNVGTDNVLVLSVEDGTDALSEETMFVVTQIAATALRQPPARALLRRQPSATLRRPDLVHR